LKFGEEKRSQEFVIIIASGQRSDVQANVSTTTADFVRWQRFKSCTMSVIDRGEHIHCERCQLGVHDSESGSPATLRKGAGTNDLESGSFSSRKSIQTRRPPCLISCVPSILGPMKELSSGWAPFPLGSGRCPS